MEGGWIPKLKGSLRTGPFVEIRQREGNRHLLSSCSFTHLQMSAHALNGGGNDGKSQAAAMNLAARTAPEPIGDAVAVLGPDAGSLVANLDGHR